MLHANATGHTAFKCKPTRAEERDTQCWNCGREGHGQWNCPEERKGKRRRRRCAICGGIGHAAFECDASIAEQEGRQCRKCGDEGHGQWQCTERRRNKPIKNLGRSQRSEPCWQLEEEEEVGTKGQHRRRKQLAEVDTQAANRHFYSGEKGEGYFEDIIVKRR